MLRFLNPILQLVLAFVFTIFFVLCFREWQGPWHTPTTLGCGTVGPEEYVPSELQAEYDLGKTIFRNNCAACHAGDMKTFLTGPPLAGSQERWAEHGGQEALYAFIRNSQKMINAGTNARANQLWEEWAPTVMNTFENLSDEELDALMIYIEQIYTYHYDAEGSP